MKLLIVSILFGVLVAIPYIFYSIKRPNTSPDFFNTASVIGWGSGLCSTAITVIKATYIAWQDPSKLGILQNDFYVIFIGCFALIWFAVQGIFKTYAGIRA